MKQLKSICSLFCFLLILFSIKAFAQDVNVDPYLQRAFGRQAGSVKKIILAKQLAADANLTSKMQSGDVMIMLDVPKPINLDNPVPPAPEAFHNSLEGFGHAALIAKSPAGSMIRLESPAILGCKTQFDIQQPYIVLRPKEKIRGAKNFSKNIDQLANQLDAIGYGYDTSFDTDVLEMSNERRERLHAAIMSYDPKTDQKPELPKFYCSEIIVTVYRLLGIKPKFQISGDDLLKVGIEPELKNGKTKEQIAQETSEGLVDTFRTSYKILSDDLADKLEYKDEYRLSAADVEKVKENYGQVQDILKQLDQNEKLLRDYVRSRMGLCDLSANEENFIQGTLKALAFHMMSQKQVVRPVDLLRETQMKDGNFEIVGYYPGNSRSKCQ